jgi:tetratricopeptide (TPR) repeat protein
MTAGGIRPAAPLPLEEWEKKLRWRFAPLLIFAGMMISLGAAAATSLLLPRHTLTGIPSDPDARAAFALLRGQTPPGMGGLRFGSEWTGETGPGVGQTAPVAAEEAAVLLARAQARRPFDARLPAALAHLDLARRRVEHAERGYRRALVLAPHYGEARLGLGVALALQAERDADPLEQRALRLEAIAQFAAVGSEDAVHAHALYDRAVLLARVGRRAEAEQRAAEYLRAYGGDAWGDSLRVRLRWEM